MKVSTILDHIDSGQFALPKFQRGYVWNRDQVRGLMDSLYRKHPVGSLLVWDTLAESAESRGDQVLATGNIKLLLDGQQRITSLYGIIKGTAPAFFDGNTRTFTGLYFNMVSEEFRFHQPSIMKGDPRWVSVTDLMGEGADGLFEYTSAAAEHPDVGLSQKVLFGRLSNILNVEDIDLHIEEVTGTDKTVEVVVDIFNRVNSGGTKLSQGDLALAKICASWPEGRSDMQSALEKWKENGYDFNLDWLLRNMNAIITGEAQFSYLHDISSNDIKDGLERAEKAVDYALNLIAGRLGLDHDRVLFGRYALPVMSMYINQRNGHIESAVERDRLLCWYFLCAMWGRFSSSVEVAINQGLEAISEQIDGTDKLFEDIRLWRGSLMVEPSQFQVWGLGARFYPVLYSLTRVGEAKDWGSGIPLKRSMLGKMSALEVHHIFPKSLLYKAGFKKSQVNAVGNYCFLTKDTNLQIGATAPSDYFPEVERQHPGALASQWIPMDEDLWTTENYLLFLEERQRLLADAANELIKELAHGAQLSMPLTSAPATPTVSPPATGIMDDVEEEAALRNINDWMAAQRLPQGIVGYELSHPDTGSPLAVLDLAWPNGIQQGYSGAVALLLNESRETLQTANNHGFRYFTTVEAFKGYVEDEITAGGGDSEWTGLHNTAA